MRYGFGFLGVFALSLMLSIGCSEGGTGDGGPVLISARDGGNASDPEVAVDPSGNAVAVFSQSDGTRYSIFANRFSPTAGWGAPEQIADDGSSAHGAQVAVDSSGNAVAVWEQFNTFANRFTPTAGWGAPEVIDDDDGADARGAQVAVDPSGNAVVVWEQSEGVPAPYTIFANRFTPTAGWGAPEQIETDDGGYAAYPQVAVDPSGTAVAVWMQSEGDRFNIFANRFTPTAGWGAAERIETDDEVDAFLPQVAVDPSSNAVVVWVQSDGTRYSIWANRFDEMFP